MNHTGLLTQANRKMKWNSIHPSAALKPESWGLSKRMFRPACRSSSTYQCLLITTIAGILLDEIIFCWRTNAGTTEGTKSLIPDLVAEYGTVVLIVHLRSDIQAKVDHE